MDGSKREIEYYTMFDDDVYISSFNNVKLQKEVSCSVIKKDGKIDIVIITVLESRHLKILLDRFIIRRDLKGDEVLNYCLQHREEDDNKINHCKLKLIGFRILIGERDDKDSAYVDRYIYHFYAI